MFNVCSVEEGNLLGGIQNQDKNVSHYTIHLDLFDLFALSFNTNLIMN